jgi:hypothetical protein
VRGNRTIIIGAPMVEDRDGDGAMMREKTRRYASRAGCRLQVFR